MSFVIRSRPWGHGREDAAKWRLEVAARLKGQPGPLQTVSGSLRESFSPSHRVVAHAPDHLAGVPGVSRRASQGVTYCKGRMGPRMQSWFAFYSDACFAGPRDGVSDGRPSRSSICTRWPPAPLRTGTTETRTESTSWSLKPLAGLCVRVTLSSRALGSRSSCIVAVQAVAGRPLKNANLVALASHGSIER